MFVIYRTIFIQSQIYFGPGQQVERNQELWHRHIWKESPRFGQASIQINGGILYIIYF